MMGVTMGSNPTIFNFFPTFFSLWMVLSSKLDFNLTLETANSIFLENIFCAIETNVYSKLIFAKRILNVDLNIVETIFVFSNE